MHNADTYITGSTNVKKCTDKGTADKEVISMKLIENGSPRIRLLG